jgi:hypothetical protein
MKTVDKEQREVAIREYYLTGDISGLRQGKDRAGLKSIGCVRRTMKKLTGDEVEETRYFIASITEVKVFAKMVRGTGGYRTRYIGSLNLRLRKIRTRRRRSMGRGN